MDGFSQFKVCVNKSSATDYLFIKQHQTREVCDQKPQDRTLFVINVSPYLTEKCIEKLFSPYGAVNKVYFHQKATATVEEHSKDKLKYFSDEIKGFKVAYVVFHQPAGLKKVLSHSLKSDEIHHIDLDACGVLLGVKKWAKIYNDSLVDEKEMTKEIESFMTNYDQKISEEKNKAKELDGVPDDEGWITVSRHSRKPVIQRIGRVDSKVAAKIKKRSLQQFYCFQIKESKMEQVAESRKRLEKDKERIAAWKAKRKFRPF